MDTEVLERTEERIDIGGFLAEFTEAFARLTPEERAYKIAKSFFKAENPTAEMREQFYGWLLDEHNREGKRVAMERIAQEYLEGRTA
jgi:hypothetical protein